MSVRGSVVRDAEFEPASVLPSQLRDWPFGGARIQPEKRLQLAVLADAFLTFRRWVGIGTRRGRRLFAEVQAWFASDETDRPFAFVTVCDSLDLESAYIRRGLERWRGGPGAPTERGSAEGDGMSLRVRLPPLRRIA